MIFQVILYYITTINHLQQKIGITTSGTVVIARLDIAELGGTKIVIVPT